VSSPSLWLRLLSAFSLLALVSVFFYHPLARMVGGALDRPVAETGPALDGEVEAVSEPPPPSFLLEIFSSPSGARVWIDAGERGQTPAVANVRCRRGDEVVVTVERAGQAPWQRRLECRPGETVTLQAELEPASQEAETEAETN